MFGICRSNPCSTFSRFGARAKAAVKPASTFACNRILGAGLAWARFCAASSRFSYRFFRRVMFIHNFYRLQEGFNPIHPATTSCEANVTFMRYLTHIGSRGGAHPLFRLDIFWGWVVGDPWLYYYPDNIKIWYGRNIWAFLSEWAGVSNQEAVIFRM